jgi:hypothetical protein
MPSHPRDVAARAARVESRESAEDPEQRILRQVIRGVLVELTCKEPHEQRPQLDHQCINRARLALLCCPHCPLDLGIVRPGLAAVSRMASCLAHVAPVAGAGTLKRRPALVRECLAGGKRGEGKKGESTNRQILNAKKAQSSNS